MGSEIVSHKDSEEQPEIMDHIIAYEEMKVFNSMDAHPQDISRCMYMYFYMYIYIYVHIPLRIFIIHTNTHIY